MIIKNRAALFAHGNVAARRAVLDILEAGLGAADPYQNVRNLIRIEGNKLIVGNDQLCPEHLPGLPLPPPGRELSGEPLVFNLDTIRHIYVVGGGKAAQSQAQAIEDVLGDRITAGHVNAKKGDEIYCKRIEITLAGHPMPDEDSVAGARRILELEQAAGPDDLVFLSESGGGSALMALPAPGITLADVQEVNRLLYFGCGAPMPVANAVRNQITVVRSKHSRHIKSTMIHIATPETPPALRVHINERPKERDSYAHAIHILKDYDLWDKVPASVRAFLLKADPDYAAQRPEEWYDKPHYYFRVMGPEYMLDAAKRQAEEQGLRAEILVSSLSDVAAQPVGETMAYVAQEIEALDRPLPSPCVLLCGGELLVAVGDEQGLGGRNQEFALAAALRIADSERIVIASADSDGADGPTDVAGAIVDGRTLRRAQEVGLDLRDTLRRHDTYRAFTALGDTIHTGILRTNVRDLRVIYVGAAE
jgi:glycerate-2-kinase